MEPRIVENVASAVRDDIGDLQTFRALPTERVYFMDPFLFLNHHGPQNYPKKNRGLPFGPHPHRGFETVTFILEGDLTHKDSAGHESTIKSGGVQWMTAGRGIVHSEVSSSDFLENGGPLEILQLWLNLPAKLKMTAPAYTGLQAEQIPVVKTSDGKCEVQLSSGSWQAHQGAITTLVPITTMIVKMETNGIWTAQPPAEDEVFFYVVRGSVEVNGTSAESHQLVRFLHRGRDIRCHAKTTAVILFCHGKPFEEPIVSHGPFVMNTKEEIYQALQDYQAGKFDEF